jgi:uncharacterized protein YehS (DUF1456 family)
MTNNYVLRRLVEIFNFDDAQTVAVFRLADESVPTEQISACLKDEHDPSYERCSDPLLATFLNGLINDKRGKKEGPQPEPEMQLTNNSILTKLKIALNLKAEDVVEIMALANVQIGKYELSAFSRKPKHHNYRECKNQFLLNFLEGVQLKYRDNIES